MTRVNNKEIYQNKRYTRNKINICKSVRLFNNGIMRGIKKYPNKL